MSDQHDYGFFRIPGPALISFSGGRTSAEMLYRSVQAWGGSLPDDVRAVFANTGREMPETLDFVRDCAERWGVPIVWLEYRDGEPGKQFAVVDYATASRDGAPYRAILERRGWKILPNQAQRWCTQDLKVCPMRDFARSLGWEHWTNIVGLRADERHRVASIRASAERARWDIAVPLADAGLTKRDISAAWAARNWGLRLPSVKDKTPLGNCDACFLKGEKTLAGIARLFPDRIKAWADDEARVGATYSKRWSYAGMLEFNRRQGDLEALPDEAATDCYCTGDA